jgi:hypothetical protein
VPATATMADIMTASQHDDVDQQLMAIADFDSDEEIQVARVAALKRRGCESSVCDPACWCG